MLILPNMDFTEHYSTLNLLPREQIENSQNFPREQFHHTAPSSFQQIVPF